MSAAPTCRSHRTPRSNRSANIMAQTSRAQDNRALRNKRTVERAKTIEAAWRERRGQARALFKGLGVKRNRFERPNQMSACIASNFLQFLPHAWICLQARTGLTGIWQASGRNSVSYAARVARDLYYVRNWSLWLDRVVLIKTVRPSSISTRPVSAARRARLVPPAFRRRHVAEFIIIYHSGPAVAWSADEIR